MEITLEKMREKSGSIVSEAIHLVVSGFAGAGIGFAIQYDGMRQAGATIAAITVTIFLVGLFRLLSGDTRLEATKEAAREAAYEGTKKALDESKSEELEALLQEESPARTED